MDSLDNEILTVRAQIDALRQRRSLLSASLLSSTRTQSLLERTNSSHSRITKKHRQQTIALARKAATTVTACVTRVTSGLTAFEAVDPDPYATLSGRTLGIRLDVYSPKQRAFAPPYFLLFRKLDDGKLELHQHTVPAFVPIRSLLQRHLSSQSDEGDISNQKSKRQNLVAFVRAVRRELVARTRRTDSINALRESAVNSHGRFGIKVVEEVDPSSRDVQLRLRNDAVIRLRLGLFGTVERFSVATGESDHASNKRRLEQALTNFTGSVHELAQVLHTVDD